MPETPFPRRAKHRDHALVGETIAGKYRVLEVLGQGGFGTVYLVEIVAGMVGEKLALKVLPAEFSGEEKLRNQFVNEIRIAMRLVDKYIIQIRDVGASDDGLLYYTMDYSPGVNLGEVLKREGKLAIPRAVLIALRVLRGLQTAHGQGVIHRDLKPANLMVEERDGKETIRILDFGIATAIQSQPAGRQGGFVGSPSYMPPEQFIGDKLGYYTDLYAVGAILYECITGQRPYHGNNPQEVYEDLKSRPVVPPAEFRPEIAGFPGLGEAINSALERNPEKRFQSARDFFAALSATLEAKAEEERRARAAAEEEQGAGEELDEFSEAEGREAAARQSGLAARRRRSRIARAKRRSPAGAAALAVGMLILVAAVVLYILHQEFGGAGNRPGAPAGPAPGANPAVAGGSRDGPAPAPPAPKTKPVEPRSSSPASPASGEPGRLAPPDPAETQRQAEAKAAEYIAQALEAHRAENWQRAIELAGDALRLHAENPQALRLKGLSEMRLGLVEEASESLQAALHLLPAAEVSTDLLLTLADARLRLGTPDREGAKSLLYKALAMEPNNPEASVKLLQMLEADGNETEIKALLSKVHGQSLPDPKADELVKLLYNKYFVELPRQRDMELKKLREEAASAFQAGNFSAAAEKAEAAYQRDPTPEIGFILAEAYRETGDFNQSLNMLQGLARRLREGDEPLIQIAVQFGRTYLAAYDKSGRKSAGDLDSALKNLSAALDLIEEIRGVNPQLEAAARTYHARCHALRGSLIKVDEDIKFAKAASDRDPDLADHQGESYYILGETARESDRETAYGRAIERFIRSMDLRNSQPAGTLYLLGLSHLKSGGMRSHYTNANNYFSRAQKAGMDTPELFQAWAEALVSLDNSLEAARKYRESYNRRPDEGICELAARNFLKANIRQSAREMVQDGLVVFPNSKKLKRLQLELGQ